MRRSIIQLFGFTLLTLFALSAHAQDTFRGDVHPETGNRLPPATPELPRGVATIAAHGSGTIVRWEFALGRPLSELAILTVARELDQPYEWSLHELEAIAVGLEPRIIDLVRHRRPPTEISELEAVIIAMGREIVGMHRLTAATYARAESLLGRTHLVDLVLLMAEYVEDGVRLTAFNQHMPPGWPQFLPLPFTLPDDIHGDSRSRLPYLREERRGPSSTPPLYGRGLAPEGTGPGQIMRRGRGQQALLDSAGPRAVRLAGLVAAREMDDAYQWTLHEIEAGADGLEPTLVDTVRRRGPVTDLAENDAALIEFGRELLTAHRVRPETYARALETFGETDLVDLVNYIAKHVSDSVMLIAFEQRLPTDQPPLLEDP